MCLYCICTLRRVCIHIKLKRLWSVSPICCYFFPATFFYWPGDQWVRKLMVFPRSWGSLPHYGIAFTRNKSQRQILCYLTFPWSYSLTNLVQFFLALFKTPWTPPPHRFEPLVDFFADWEALCTALRLENIRHRSEEAMSKIPWNLNKQKVFLCQFWLNSMLILCQFDVKIRGGHAVIFHMRIHAVAVYEQC